MTDEWQCKCAIHTGRNCRQPLIRSFLDSAIARLDLSGQVRLPAFGQASAGSSQSHNFSCSQSYRRKRMVGSFAVDQQLHKKLHSRDYSSTPQKFLTN